MNRFDWSALLRAAAAMGLRPGEFWRLTPAEFSLLAGGGTGAPLNRGRLDELVAAFPDTPSEDRHGR